MPKIADMFLRLRRIFLNLFRQRQHITVAPLEGAEGKLASVMSDYELGQEMRRVMNSELLDSSPHPTWQIGDGNDPIRPRQE